VICCDNLLSRACIAFTQPTCANKRPNNSYTQRVEIEHVPEPPPANGHLYVRQPNNSGITQRRSRLRITQTPYGTLPSRFKGRTNQKYHLDILKLFSLTQLYQEPSCSSFVNILLKNYMKKFENVKNIWIWKMPWKLYEC